jgi:cell division septum initiation protein DivIVA
MAMTGNGDGAKPTTVAPQAPEAEGVSAPPRESERPPRESERPPRESERRLRRVRSSPLSGPERDRMIADMRRIEFPIGLRGYERTAVDRYVEQVNRLLAELEISSSPESAVRHALDEVSEETRDLLQRAHETAEEIAARSRVKAEERLERAEAEAAELGREAEEDAAELRAAVQREVRELREAAEHEAQEVRSESRREADALRASVQREADELRSAARTEAEDTVTAAALRARELTRSAETIWRERRRLIDDMRAVGDQLVAIGETEGKRFPHFIGDTLTDSDPPAAVAAES